MASVQVTKTVKLKTNGSRITLGDLRHLLAEVDKLPDVTAVTVEQLGGYNQMDTMVTTLTVMDAPLMARAYIEEISVDSEQIDAYTSRSTEIVRVVPLHEVSPPPPPNMAVTAVPRARFPYYFGWCANVLLWIGAAFLIGYLVTDDVTDDRYVGAPIIMIIMSLALGAFLADQKPQVCTCPSHRYADGCEPGLTPPPLKYQGYREFSGD